MFSLARIPPFKVDGYTTKPDDLFGDMQWILETSEETWSGSPILSDRESIEPILWIPKLPASLSGGLTPDEWEAADEKNIISRPSGLRLLRAPRSVIYTQASIPAINSGYQACLALQPQLQAGKILACRFPDAWQNSVLPIEPLVCMVPPENIEGILEVYGDETAGAIVPTANPDNWYAGDTIYVFNGLDFTINTYYNGNIDSDGYTEFPVIKQAFLDSFNAFKSAYSRLKVFIVLGVIEEDPDEIESQTAYNAYIQDVYNTLTEFECINLGIMEPDSYIAEAKTLIQQAIVEFFEL